MSLAGPVVVIDDDPDDQELMQDAFTEIGLTNQLVFFHTGGPAIEYLKTTTDSPFVILSDINLPQQNGIEFKREIDSIPYLRQKSIPFIFFSTFVDNRVVEMAYNELTIQGFFKKSSRYEELKNTVKLIMEYWKICQHPNSQ
jgi:response regulator RpfG family c-di-GMP phosphodiesterase